MWHDLFEYLTSPLLIIILIFFASCFCDDDSFSFFIPGLIIGLIIAIILFFLFRIFIPIIGGIVFFILLAFGAFLIFISNNW